MSTKKAEKAKAKLSLRVQTYEDQPGIAHVHVFKVFPDAGTKTLLSKETTRALAEETAALFEECGHTIEFWHAPNPEPAPPLKLV